MRSDKIINNPQIAVSGEQRKFVDSLQVAFRSEVYIKLKTGITHAILNILESLKWLIAHCNIAVEFFLHQIIDEPLKQQVSKITMKAIR